MEKELLFIDKIRQYLDYRNIESELQEKQGAFFNVFYVLGVESKETRHSSFLAELLNPCGSHGQRDRFLRMFMQQVPVLRDFPFDTRNATVVTEEVIPQTEENQRDTGRMDIVIHSGNDAIIIENKIYAQDQEEQLLRYYHYAQREVKGRFIILYLTLDGKEATMWSTNQELIAGKDYFQISYKDDINAWLNQCEDSVRNLTNLYTIICQYHQIIKNLTNTNMEQDNQILNLMLANNEVVLELANNIGNWKQNIKERAISKFKEELKEKICKPNDLELDYDERDGRFDLCPKDSNWVYSFTYDGYGTGGMYFGVRSKLGERFSETYLLDGMEGCSQYWPFGWKYFDEKYRYYIPYYKDDEYNVQLLKEDYLNHYVDYINKAVEIMREEMANQPKEVARVQSSIINE